MFLVTQLVFPIHCQEPRKGYFARCKSKGDLTVSAVKAPKIIPISLTARFHFVARKKGAKTSYTNVFLMYASYFCDAHVASFVPTHAFPISFFFSPPRGENPAHDSLSFPLFRSIFRLWIKDIKRINHISMRKEVFSDFPLILCRFFPPRV